MKPTPVNVDLLIDLDYNHDIRALREEFAAVNSDSTASLRNWFATHPYLTVHDMSRIGDVCHRTVYLWRKRAKWKPDDYPKKIAKPPRPIPRRNETPVAPPDWDTDWLIDMYVNKGYSIPQLARSINRAQRSLRTRLNRRIKLRAKKDSVRTKHPCFKLSWVFEHYVHKKMSQAKMSKIAGVSRYTIAVWLDHFKIRVRTIGEQIVVNHASPLDKRRYPQVTSK